MRGNGATRAVAALDAGRGDVVCCAYALGGARAEALGEPERVSPERARELAGGAAIAALPRDLLGVPGVAEARLRPAAALARAVAAAPGSDATSLAAIYSRPSAAEEKRGVSS